MTQPTVEFENDRVRVSRARQVGAGPRLTQPRRDRLIVYLTDSEITRTEDGAEQRHSRRTGEVVWRDASEQSIRLHDDGEHEVLIVEFK
jgi:hypothetical protein